MTESGNGNEGSAERQDAGGEPAGSGDYSGPSRSYEAYAQVPDPSEDVLRRHRAKVLRPEDAVRQAGDPPPNPTVYLYESLLVPAPLLRNADFMGFVETVAADLGITVDNPLVSEDPERPADPLQQALDETGTVIRRRLRLQVSPDSPPDRPVDAWQLLQRLRWAARRQPPTDAVPDWSQTVAQVTLEHLLMGHQGTREITIVGAPGTEGHGGGGGPFYGPHSCGRVPVAVVSGPPERHSDVFRRRPCVAVLDTGCGQNPWLSRRSAGVPDAFVDDVLPTFAGGGFIPPADNAETNPSQTAPLLGQLDRCSGHGTFIAGIVRQVAPDARVLSIPIMHSDGAVEEGDLDAALGLVHNRVVNAQQQGGDPADFVDVVSLSLGYYDENPQAGYTVGLEQIIQQLAACGVAVVASAGNDATDRPAYPAAFAAAPSWPPPVRVTSVGATNPNGTRAIFSNQGSWVSRWFIGSAVVSTLPTSFDGSQTPPLHNTAVPPATRDGFDPDNFAWGFATWCGTSFAAAYCSARLAAELCCNPSALMSIDANSASQRINTALNQIGG